METHLTPEVLAADDGQRADQILRACVHCGFCTATCPTYLLTGDERDGPRGRIYLIKAMLEGETVSRRTQRHLDRCLTCRACETTCPSGVAYAELLDIGRHQLAQKVDRSWPQQFLRSSLLWALPKAQRVAVLLFVARFLRPVLPEGIKAKVPVRQKITSRSEHTSNRQMVILEGCVQAATTPATNAALRRILARVGIGCVSSRSVSCCGALHHHLDEQERSRAVARNNIDAWWALLQQGAEALIVSASGCGVQVKEYGRLLHGDPRYAEKAEKVAKLARDPSEVITTDMILPFLPNQRQTDPVRIAFHSPCSLQHGQGISGKIEALLNVAGFTVLPVSDSHLCCGSAGTYSLLQPELSRQLLTLKVSNLMADNPSAIVTANVGCQLHLASAAQIPVKHWLDLLDEALAPKD